MSVPNPLREEYERSARKANRTFWIVVVACVVGIVLSWAHCVASMPASLRSP